ncbi:Tol-Pal system beta propeller repeat protein TolB [Paucibacter sp. APW11]|uniref:Tol-Pal system protein TolB n=1 Tax=Roseateles aquae TaxID=3077235 RepID=A0ABU3P9P6_9BURK|nr:Tol-Pal system beta propeller repeat protein TolB [Paucibacter sp. APW11]MDT8999260.1 Tol-Pal system beta propeller repeat protein TolB [Paucibacter sp. APW11]
MSELNNSLPNPLPNLLRRRELLTAAGLGLSLPALAQFRVEISGVGGTQTPIAINDFRDEAQTGQPVAAIIRADLERSGQFRVTPNTAPMSETSLPAFNEWRAKAVDALVAGSATRLADGRYDLRYKLWDVVKGQDQGGESQAVAADDVRLAAHRIADSIYQKLTGERGVFATRMAYVTKAGGRYSLRITDADGEGGQIALASPEPIISPAWSPDGKELAYVSFETRKAVVWVQELATGRRRMVANFRGSNSAPAFSPDGQRLAMTLSRDGGSQLFVMGRNGDNVKRLTQTRAIDTEPVFTPDGQKIYFVSDRGGSPQIYRMPADGGEAERVTFNGSYNISPTISPDGRTLAFITREGGSTFRLCVMDLASGVVQKISDTTDDESPSFAPNGRLIVYATRSGGRDVLVTTTLDGRIKAKLVSTLADVREPTWGPFGR